MSIEIGVILIVVFGLAFGIGVLILMGCLVKRYVLAPPPEFQEPVDTAVAAGQLQRCSNEEEDDTAMGSGREGQSPVDDDNDDTGADERADRTDRKTSKKRKKRTPKQTKKKQRSNKKSGKSSRKSQKTLKHKKR